MSFLRVCAATEDSPLLQRVLNDETLDGDGLLLSHAMHAVIRLRLGGEIP
jgi:hypothetical protein